MTPRDHDRFSEPFQTLLATALELGHEGDFQLRLPLSEVDSALPISHHSRLEQRRDLPPQLDPVRRGEYPHEM